MWHASLYTFINTDIYEEVIVIHYYNIMWTCHFKAK